MNPDYEVIASTDCRDGNCPTLWRNRTTGEVRVRGYDPADPTREIDVTIPAADWAVLASQL